jgi:molybdenum cofactor cytidylyltransferase
MSLAVVPAGGHSKRLGRPKLVLPLAGRTVIEHVVTALRGGGCEHVVVVVGPHVPELVPLAKSAGAETCVLAAETADMRATVEHGLDWLEECYQPRPDDPWLLAPGDQPTLDARVVQQLFTAYNREKYSVLVPSYRGRRGHPTLMAWRHASGIRDHTVGAGIDTYLRSRLHETLAIPVTQESVLDDLDTPADYERLRALYGT